MLKTILTLLCALLILNSQAQNASDTIKIRKEMGRVYIYNGMKLKPKHLLSIMEPNPAAYSEMKRAKTNYDVGSVFGFAGGFLVGWSIGAIITGGEVDWRIAGAGAALIGASIPFSIGQTKHTKKAVKMFNNYKKSTTSSIQLKMNVAINKVGIVANF